MYSYKWSWLTVVELSIAGTVSGVEAAIHCGDGLAFKNMEESLGPTLATARYRYVNAIETPALAVHR